MLERIVCLQDNMSLDGHQVKSGSGAKRGPGKDATCHFHPVVRVLTPLQFLETGLGQKRLESVCASVPYHSCFHAPTPSHLLALSFLGILDLNQEKEGGGLCGFSSRPLLRIEGGG